MLILEQLKGQPASVYSERKPKILVWLAENKNSVIKSKPAKEKYEIRNNIVLRIHK